MDPFEEFESASNKVASDDPAADFLAREQAELDKIENDDFFSAAPAAASNEQQGSSDPFGMGDNNLGSMDDKENEPAPKVTFKFA